MTVTLIFDTLWLPWQKEKFRIQLFLMFLVEAPGVEPGSEGMRSLSFYVLILPINLGFS